MIQKFSFLLTITLVFSAVILHAQTDYSQRQSPPAGAKGALSKGIVAVSYSQPSVKGRTIWGELVPYNKIWRTGANEATVFETDHDILFGDTKLTAGKYALFTIPGENEWTIILNSEWNQWGNFKYDQGKDVLRVTAKPQKSTNFNERLKFEVSDGHLAFMWENLQWFVPVSSL